MFDQLVTEFAQQSNLYVDEIKVDEFHLYGSSRLGVYEANRLISKRVARDLNLDNQITKNEYVIETPEEVTYLFSSYQLERGAKRYELANHLGNVLTVISDKKTAVFTGTMFNYFAAERISATDYSPFGAPLAGRTWNGGEYRFGFGGQEKDDEISSSGNTMTTEFWEYDSRLGRRWNVDPITKPSESPYVGFSNNPIVFTDPSGLKIINANRVKSEEAKNNAKSLKEQLSKLDKDKDKVQIDKLNDQIKEQESKAAHQDEMADRLDKLLATYKKVDETSFNKMDNLKNAGGENVDVYLEMDFGFVFSEGYAGGTEFNFEKDADGFRVIAGTLQSGDKWMRPASKEYKLNTIHITLDASVGLNPFVGGETVAHEFCHADFQAVFTMTYYKYVRINYNQVTLHGGHGLGDPSGDAARIGENVYKEKLKEFRRKQ
jgi:RHS repeat-associated protein